MKTKGKATKTAAPEADEVLKIAVVYQDDLTQEWAKQTCQVPVELVEPERINITWWSTKYLSDHAVFVEAVGAAAKADIIACSVHGAEELPPEFLAWIDTWLPRRQQRPGALLALIGTTEETASQAEATREYLRAVACKGMLDLFTRDFRGSGKNSGLTDRNPPG